MFSAVTIPLLAFGFWLRGSALFERLTGRGATTARLVCWALPCGLAWWALGGNPLYAAGAAVAAWLGTLLGWWGSLDLGRNEGTWLEDFLLHTARGVLWTAPMAAVALVQHEAWWWMLGVGALCGLLYELGYQLNEARGTEIGEFLFGAVIGAAMVVTWAT